MEVSSESPRRFEDADDWQESQRRRVRECRDMTPAWMWPDVDVLDLPDPPIDVRVLPTPAKYRRLDAWFAGQTEDLVEIPITQLAELITGELPARIDELLHGRRPPRSHERWWVNNPRKAHCRAWVNNGYRAVGAGTFVRKPLRGDTRAEVIGMRTGWLNHAARCTCTGQDGEGPAGVYVTHLRELGLFKVGVGRRPEDRSKAQHTRGGKSELIQVVNVTRPGESGGCTC